MNNSILQKLDEIMKRLDKIEKTIGNDPHEYGDTPSSPPINPFDIPYPKKFDDMSYRCSACGQRFEGLVGYVCSRLDCPMFTRVTFNTSTTGN